MWRIERIKECETGNNLSYPSCTVCSRTTKNIEKSAPFPLQKWKLIKGQRFGNGHPCLRSGAAFNQPYPKYGWISFSLIDFKSSVCRFRRIMCVFISLHSYCRAGLWSKFNVFLFFLYFLLIILPFIFACVGFCPHGLCFAGLFWSTGWEWFTVQHQFRKIYVHIRYVYI